MEFAVSLSLNDYLAVHEASLKLSAKRSEVLAANLANADTPGYRARDIDFASAMAQASGTSSGVAMQATQAGHISTSGTNGDVSAQLKYRVPLAPALDGNSVETQVEQANFAQNTVRYQSTLTFLNAKFRGLLTAITGQ